MSDCLFCDPARSRVLCESDGWYVRYDEFPATPGHVEVIPRRHVQSLFDLTAVEVAEAYDLMRGTQRILAADYVIDGWNIGVNDGGAAGQTVPHLHIHLIPRRFGDQDDPRGGIRRGLPNGDPDLWGRVEYQANGQEG